MCNNLQLSERQEALVKEIVEQRQSEVQAAVERKRLHANLADKRLQQARKAMRASGLDLAALEELDESMSEQMRQETKEIEAEMNAGSERIAARDTAVDASRFLDVKDLRVLQPAWTAVFSDDDEEDEKTGALALRRQALATHGVTLSGGGCQDYYNWASGAGSGLFGTGVGQIQSWVYFGFWFRPPTSRFYSIIPQFRFRGYYIVRADDGFFTSKYARVVVSAWTNVHQYNWKGWNHVNVLDVGGDNINVNQRFDDDRYPYNSYLLGGGDWAWISCVVGLYAYARGGGSYAKNDFATGNANYLCVPNVYVY